MLSLDTNILAYAIDEDANVRHDHAVEIVGMAASAGAVLTEQSIFELLNLSMVKAKRSRDEADAIVDELLRHYPLIYPPRDIVARVLELLRNHKLSVWDARMLAVCAANDCEILLSEDMQDGAVYGGVQVLSPFAARNSARIRALLE